MSFGLKFLGASGQVVIDEDFPCMHLVAAGTYPATTTSIITVTYPAAIGSPVAPFVFFKPNGAHHITNFRHTGSAGNWTGFTFYCKVFNDTSGVVLGGAWKACAVYMPKAAGSYGMLVKDAQNRIVFDSNRDLIRFLSGQQNWSYYGTNKNYLNQWTLHSWQAPWPHGSDGYFLVSHFSADATFPGRYGECSVGFINAARSPIIITVQEGGASQDSITSAFNWPLVAIA